MYFVKYLFSFVYRDFDLIFLIFFFGVYLYLAIFKKARAMLRFLFVCILWASSAVWTSYIPDKYQYLFSEGPGDIAFPGYVIPLGGFVYGIPLTIITFITWRIKKQIEDTRKEKNTIKYKNIVK